MAARPHSEKVAEEVEQIQKDIQRLGEKNADGKYSVKFGKLYDDEFTQQYYEAMMGTLKAAKKKGFITYKGELLLKGAHDNVDIILLNDPPQ